MALSRMGIATGSASLLLVARAANAFVIWDLVRVATGNMGRGAVVWDDRFSTVVQPASSTLGDATGGTTLGGCAVGVAVGGVLIFFAAVMVSGCVLVECSSVRRVSMAASWS